MISRLLPAVSTTSASSETARRTPLTSPWASTTVTGLPTWRESSASGVARFDEKRCSTTLVPAGSVTLWTSTVAASMPAATPAKRTAPSAPMSTSRRWLMNAPAPTPPPYVAPPPRQIETVVRASRRSASARPPAKMAMAAPRPTATAVRCAELEFMPVRA